jgi:hypothetical protein
MYKDDKLKYMNNLKDEKIKIYPLKDAECIRLVRMKVNLTDFQAFE